MKRWLSNSIYAGFAVLSLTACQPPVPSEHSQPLVSYVDHTAVKRQAIGNCWLYAQASWLESLLKTSTGHEVNVSETYWTYWDFFEKIRGGAELDEEGVFPTGGQWYRSRELIQRYGWVEQQDFQAEEESPEAMSDMQACAKDELSWALHDGGELSRPEDRTEAHIIKVLDRAFSCSGRYRIDGPHLDAHIHAAKATQVVDPKTRVSTDLATMMQRWNPIANPAEEPASLGKGLLTRSSRNALKGLEQRIKRALNDHQPVVLSFQVSFNAPNDAGVFNLDTLADAREMGHQGGHMLVLHDYTVTDAPGFAMLGEGDLPESQKAAALQGQLETLVAKNSWGSFRGDRPWLGNGFSRFTWDYLTARYWDEKSESFQPFLQDVILPEGY